jgi:glycosyltransferase involved in cell wall biosynthesis
MTHVRFNRIAIFIDSMGGGGAERVTANLANHWAVKGWEVTVITMSQIGMDVYELHPDVKRIALNLADDSGNIVSMLWKNIHRVIALRMVLRKIQPDIVLGMMTIANVILALATIGLRIQTVGSEHTHPAQYPLGALRDGLRRFTYCLLHNVTALTSESASWLKANTLARRINVIPNAAPWPLPDHEPRISPESVRPFGRKFLLGAGRLVEEKGFDLLLSAFTSLAQKYPDWDLVIVGEGSQRTIIEDLVGSAGLKKRVFLPGRVGNLGVWYEYADLYVMSSRFEGFGNTLAEALAYGLPVVSFDCDSGPRNIIRQEVDGLLVPPGDVAGLAATLDRLMGDVNLRERFARRAVEARMRFSIDRIASMWEELFEGNIK